MTRTRRDRLIRSLLVIGGLTAIATSAPEPHIRHDQANVFFDAGETQHVTVRLTESAHRTAEVLVLTFHAIAHLSDPTSTVKLEVTPDFEGLEPRILALFGRSVCTSCKAGTSAPRPHAVEDDAGPSDDGRPDPDPPPPQAGSAAAEVTSNQVGHHIDQAQLRDLCPEQGNCVLGFTIVRMADPADRGADVSLSVTATVERNADNSFVCAADRDFDDRAKVEVTDE